MVAHLASSASVSGKKIVTQAQIGLAPVFHNLMVVAIVMATTINEDLGAVIPQMKDREGDVF